MAYSGRALYLIFNSEYSSVKNVKYIIKKFKINKDDILSFNKYLVYSLIYNNTFHFSKHKKIVAYVINRFKLTNNDIPAVYYHNIFFKYYTNDIKSNHLEFDTPVLYKLLRFSKKDMKQIHYYQKSNNCELVCSICLEEFSSNKEYFLPNCINSTKEHPHAFHKECFHKYIHGVYRTIMDKEINPVGFNNDDDDEDDEDNNNEDNNNEDNNNEENIQDETGHKKIRYKIAKLLKINKFDRSVEIHVDYLNKIKYNHSIIQVYFDKIKFLCPCCNTRLT